MHAALLIGSYARVDVPADQWSDIDIILVVDDPEPYAAGADWLGVFGQPLLTFLEPTAVGAFVERRVLFQAGQEVDFALLPLAAVEHLAEQAALAAVLGRGFRVLVDKAGLEPALRRAASAPPPSGQPTPAAFAQLTHDFWYHALWAAKSCGGARCGSPSRAATAISRPCWSGCLPGTPRPAIHRSTPGTVGASSSGGPTAVRWMTCGTPTRAPTATASPAPCGRRWTSLKPVATIAVLSATRTGSRVNRRRVRTRMVPPEDRGG